MNHKIIIISLLFVCIASSCSKYKNCPVILGESFILNYNQTLCSEKNNLKITFNAVEDDSRCPTGAACIWEGVGTIQLTLQKDNQPYPFRLSTSSSKQLQPGFKNDTVVAGFKIKLIQLDPYPSAQPPVVNAYKAKLVITQ